MDLQTIIKDAHGTSEYINVINEIAGQEFKIKHSNGKWKQYTMKSGKRKTGFWCPFCPFGSDRAANLKLHVGKCESVNPLNVPKAQKQSKIQLCDVNLEVDMLDEEIDNLVISMREITDVKMNGPERQRYVGALAWKFRNNFIPNTMFKNRDWEKIGLDKSAKQNGGNVYYDERFMFGFFEEANAPSSVVPISEIIPYLINHFRPIFMAAFQIIKKDDFAPPIWYWNRALFGVNHIDDREHIDLSNQDLVMLPEPGSSQWQKDQIEMLNKSKPVYAC